MKVAREHRREVKDEVLVDDDRRRDRCRAVDDQKVSSSQFAVQIAETTVTDPTIVGHHEAYLVSHQAALLWWNGCCQLGGHGESVEHVDGADQTGCGHLSTVSARSSSAR